MNLGAAKSMADFSDNEIIEEAAVRLQRQFESEHRLSFRFGTFRFIFHDGHFQSVEDWPRNKRYISSLHIGSKKNKAP